MRLEHIADAEQLLDAQDALFGERRRAVFFFDRVIAGGVFFARLLAFDDLAALQVRNDLVGLVILVGRFLAGTGNDERRARLVDEDRIHFIHDGEVMAALHAVLDVELHVVAQIIEAELVVRAVSNVGAVVLLALVVVEVVDDGADGEAQEAVHPAHPFGVAFGEVIVDGDDVNALAFERVEVAGQGGDERFAFAGLHFGDAAFVQNHAADQLDVEVAHVENAPAGLAAYGEGFDQQVVERGAAGRVFL